MYIWSEIHTYLVLISHFVTVSGMLGSGEILLYDEWHRFNFLIVNYQFLCEMLNPVPVINNFSASTERHTWCMYSQHSWLIGRNVVDVIMMMMKSYFDLLTVPCSWLFYACSLFNWYYPVSVVLPRGKSMYVVFMIGTFWPCLINRDRERYIHFLSSSI